MTGSALERLARHGQQKSHKDKLCVVILHITATWEALGSTGIRDWPKVNSFNQYFGLVRLPRLLSLSFTTPLHLPLLLLQGLAKRSFACEGLNVLHVSPEHCLINRVRLSSLPIAPSPLPALMHTRTIVILLTTL
jgi:hypothetical protein